jgi:hypothetical protein
VTSYARLMCDQGRIREAYDLLEPIYGWFTEGFGDEGPEGSQGAARPADVTLHRAAELCQPESHVVLAGQLWLAV